MTQEQQDTINSFNIEVKHSYGGKLSDFQIDYLIYVNFMITVKGEYIFNESYIKSKYEGLINPPPGFPKVEVMNEIIELIKLGYIKHTQINRIYTDKKGVKNWAKVYKFEISLYEEE